MGKSVIFLLLVVALTFVSWKVIAEKLLEDKSGLSKGDTLLVAHRGLSGSHPENTLAAFEAAFNKAYMIELDVHLTKDKVLVVMHDDTLDRTTNGKGKISDFTLEEIKKLDAGSWFGEEFANEKVPTLEEVLGVIKGKIKLNIEIKEAEDKSLNSKTVEECVSLVKKFNMVEDVIVSSFDHDILSSLKEFAPEFRIYLLFFGLVEQDKLLDYAKDRKADGVNVDSPSLTSKIIENLKGGGLKVGVYTINDIDEAKKFLEFGVDFIYSDMPDKLV